MSVEAEIFRGKGPSEIAQMKGEITEQRTILSRDAVCMDLVPFFDGFFWTDPAFKQDWFTQPEREFVSYREQVRDGKLALVRYETHPLTEDNRAEETNNRLEQVLLLSRNYELTYWDNFKSLEFPSAHRKIRKSRGRH